MAAPSSLCPQIAELNPIGCRVRSFLTCTSTLPGRYSRIILVIIRERRTFVLRARILLQLFQEVLDGSFELRVTPLPPSRWIEINFDVGRDADVLDFPVALESIQRRARRADESAIHQ